MSFPVIQGPLDPEEYSWEVELGEGMTLKELDSETAGVYFEDGTEGMLITAGAAHDSSQSQVAVPTTLAVTGPNVITLTVHHRAGNPTAGGASFTYPIVPGQGFEWHYVPVIDPNPKYEVGSEEGCVVPKLKGRTLKASKQQLREANCKVGKVTKLRGATAEGGRVARQSPVPGGVLAPGAAVKVTLALGH